MSGIPSRLGAAACFGMALELQLLREIFSQLFTRRQPGRRRHHQRDPRLETVGEYFSRRELHRCRDDETEDSILTPEGARSGLCVTAKRNSSSGFFRQRANRRHAPRALIGAAALHEIVMPAEYSDSDRPAAPKTGAFAAIFINRVAVCERINLAKRGRLLLKGYCAGFGQEIQTPSAGNSRRSIAIVAGRWRRAASHVDRRRN